MRRWIIAGIVAALAWGPGAAARGAQPKITPSPTPTREKPAQEVAERWLPTVDAGQYGESWDAAAALFKQTVNREQWIDALTKRRSPLGQVQSRKLRVAQYVTDMPGAPSGEYVVIEYDTAFSAGGAMIERVTPMKDPDGSWRVSGYFVLPAK
ncbi:MAG: DUF4019 domain-containing protein [Acidobacteriota bacterium]